MDNVKIELKKTRIEEEKRPSVVQEFLGRGNVVLREANGGKELANITADLSVTFQPSTSPESNKHRKNSITCVSINKNN